MSPRKETQALIPSKKVLEAQRGYQPIMGDAQDIYIRDTMMRIEKKLRTVDNKELRRLEEEGDLSKMSTKMREIIRDEQSVVFQMEQRKFDF